MKKRLSILFSLLLVMSLFLAACGFNKESGGSENASSDGGDKKKEQELRVNIKTEPFSLNPGLANDSTSSNVLLQTFEGLTRIGKDGKPENAMAKDVKVSDDQTKYTFTIRDDAKWSNGDPVTAKDFEYAWKWALDPKNESQYAYQLYYVKNAQAANEGKGSLDDVAVKATDDKTLEVTLENPTPYFLELTAFYTYFPVNTKIAESNEKWYTNAGENYTSNGPFKLKTWKHNDKIELVPNENYWDKDAVKLKKVEMYMINDNNTELSMFKNGELDWAGMPTGQLPADALPELKKDASELPAIKVSYNTDEKHAKIAQAVQDMWKKNLGIKVQLDNSEWAVYIEKLHQGDYQVGRMGWLGDFNDPINFLELFRDKKGGNNDTNWENPEYKKLLIDSQKETDPKKRLEMLKKAEGIFMDEMPVAPIYFYTNAWVQDKQLKDVVMSGLGDIQIKWAHFE